ncbi:hypothetical protein [Selenomonas ruminis]|uniref:Uncharacterized protein n=1 Tax=Selenomonas ruminis TaxID=2593411 RepID=A0A5D6W788_9FIRM|nr:hypothetical protein [Selenomonas sp. mPRGC5]TYZ23332.1 hypothetical protein FZ040_05470 [Selenomonas sp. mPRGC5]
MMKKKFAALLTGLMVLTAVPAFAASSSKDANDYGPGYCRQHNDCPNADGKNHGRHGHGCFRGDK